jgi:O-antigen ligase
MFRRVRVEVLGTGLLVCLLALCLFGDEFSRASSGLVGSISREISGISRNPSTQWMVLVCFVFYFLAFSIFELRSLPKRKWPVGNPICSQCLFVVFALLGYGFAYSTASKNAMIPIFFGTLVFGKVVAFWARWKTESMERRFSRILAVLILALVAASLWREKGLNTFQYHQVPRWSGPWDNPNLFGLLMGTAVVLSFSMGTRAWKARSVRFTKIIWVFACALTFVLCGWALIKSFSRGAWCGTVIGLTYLGLSSVLSLQPSIKSWFCRNWIRFSVILVSAIVLSFWQFRFTEWPPARRVFSAANVNDFSWRNRTVAWQGASRMMADRPWLGFGWAQAEAAYEKKYRPPQIENGAAIQMNDYFMLGISAGVPALICFLVYVGLSLRSPQSIRLRNTSAAQSVHSPQLPTEPGAAANDFKDLDWLQATCRAGVIVLLVGFFFDGGLFKLATGSVFWILLELGRGNVYRRDAETQKAVCAGTDRLVRSLAPPDKIISETPAVAGKWARWEVWLRRSAWILGIAAVSESVILLATPFFGVNSASLAISRHYLVPPAAVADLNVLATNVDWSSRKLRPLLQHASLANYNRQLVNWKLDDATYRDYVLNPLIDSQRDDQLAWRRSLWEYFYLPIRKENDPKSAAEIVLKFLHQRISIVEKGPVTIEAMWQQKQADAAGLEALKVASFRSVGIAARLNESGQAEISSNEKWRLAPKESE